MKHFLKCCLEEELALFVFFYFVFYSLYIPLYKSDSSCSSKVEILFFWLPKSLWTSPYNLEFSVQDETPQRLAETFDANCYTRGSLLQPVSKEAISIERKVEFWLILVLTKSQHHLCWSVLRYLLTCLFALFDLFKFSRWWRWFFFMLKWYITISLPHCSSSTLYM